MSADDLRAPHAAARIGAPRERLRAATRDIHDRLHSHPAFRSLMTGASDVVSYARLLGQLHGFHASAETAIFSAAEVLLPELDDLPRRRKAHLLQMDLISLARCSPNVPSMPPDHIAFETALSRPAILGCLYVIEGATLGGRELGRLAGPALDSCGLVVPEGRRFLLAYGSSQGAMWRRFCDVLEAVGSTFSTTDRQMMEAAARSTFLAMENWLTI